MTSVMKLPTAPRKMKLPILLMESAKFPVLLILIALATALFAETPRQQTRDILRPTRNQTSIGKRAQAVHAPQPLPGDSEATEIAQATTNANVGSPQSNEQLTSSQNTMVWTNDNLEKLHSLGLISIVGRMDEEKPTPAPTPEPYVRTQDPEWYAAQAAKLQDELERRQTQLREYQQAISDVQNLKQTTGGVNLDEGDLAITPEVGIEILERHVNQVQAEINDLEDLARHHGIPPGALRGQ
jgi:hypothetical protein